jgi:replicative DNA helicase
MMNHHLLDNIAFAAIIKHPEYLETFKPEFFDEKLKGDLLKITIDHYKKYHETPSSTQLKELYRLTNPISDFSLIENYIDMLFEVDLTKYTHEWLDKAMQAFISYKQLDSSVRNLITYIKTNTITMENIDSVLQTARGIITEGTDIKFNVDLGADVFNPDSYKLSETYKVSSGYDFIDTVTKGGFSNPGLHILSAPPKTGKCITGDTKIKVRNIKQQKEYITTVQDFYFRLDFNNKVEIIDSKFIEKLILEDWEIETPNGWESVDEIGKTIKYDVYELVTECNKTLKCADKHIIIDEFGEEKYLIDLRDGDKIRTKSGISSIRGIYKYDYQEHMYDFKMSENTSRTYYTNDILSHNTIWLGNIAIEMMKSGKNGIFVSLEMPEFAMLQRFGPKMFNIKSDAFEEISQNPYMLGKVIQQFKSSSTGMGDSLFDSRHPGELFLKEFPTSTATTNDLRTYVVKLMEKKKIKIDFLVLDYINIMANWRNPNTDNTYMKIKQIAEDLRAISQTLGFPIISATQTKRGVEDTSDFSSSDVAESSGLAHTVDSLWGIIMTPEMYANREYVLKNLLNRHGGMKFAKKKFKVDFDYMNIIETNEPIYDDYNQIYQV